MPMWLKWATLILGIGLAGCASSPGSSRTCTDILSVSGALLQFCQSERQLDILETGIQPDPKAQDVKLINNPTTLLALQKNLSLRSDLKSSRRLISKACQVNGNTYLSIDIKSFNRILGRKSPAPIED